MVKKVLELEIYSPKEGREHELASPPPSYAYLNTNTKTNIDSTIRTGAELGERLEARESPHP